ncbi:MAG: DUF3501 family protein [Gammaproteobacteria bacterium]
MLTRKDLFSLEEYATKRAEFRAKVLEHKNARRVVLDPHMTLYFEDRLTIQYQVQEMLRIEKIFEPAGIEDELAAYNPLIPDGTNLKATYMIEYPDVAERRVALAKLVGVEHRVWLRVDGFDKVYAVANEDLDRSTDEKTSSVHFMRFEFDEAMRSALKRGAALAAGCDHPAATIDCTVDDATRDALVTDFD